MKESWLYYDYLRRWWRLLILVGLAYYSVQKQSKSYAATGTVAIGNLVDDMGGISPSVVVTIASGKQSTADAAVANVQTAFDRVTKHANNPVVIPKSKTH